MTKQPEALRLADYLHDNFDLFPNDDEFKAAAELRRLHEELESHRRVMFRLGQVNAQLLEALGEIEWSNTSEWQADRARAAIAAAKEGA